MHPIRRQKKIMIITPRRCARSTHSNNLLPKSEGKKKKETQEKKKRKLKKEKNIPAPSASRGDELL